MFFGDSSDVSFCVVTGEAHANAVTFGNVITACHNVSHWQKALRLFASMEPTTVNYTSIACNAAISACEKGAKWRTLHIEGST